MDETEEKKDKLVFMITKSGAENAEIVLLPLVQAVGALTMDVEVVLVLMAAGVWMAKKDYASHVRFPDKPPGDELIRNFLELGGKLLLCKPCSTARDLKEEDFVKGAEWIATARLIDEVLSAKAVLSY